MKKTLTFVLILLSFSLTAQHLPIVKPEEAGLSSAHMVYADLLIDNAIANNEIPGAVLAVVKDGKMAYLKAYGNKSVYPKIEKMETNTVFDLASVSKSIATATSLMILVEQGKLRLQDNVKLFIPGFQGWKHENGRVTDIKIIDLMTHTSGLPPYVAPAELQKKHGAPNPDAVIEYVSTCKRDFALKTNMQYSCLNYITMQRIIETVSGDNLQEFAKKHIFEPLGMRHTDFRPSGETLERTAPTEKMADGTVLRGVVHDPLARIMNDGISGNAGLFSDANDIAIYVAALQNGGEWNGKRILSPLSVKKMRTVPDDVMAFGRSPGWDVSSAYSSNNGELLSPASYGHTGYTGTSVTIDPDNNIGVILLTHRVHPSDKGSVVRLRTMVANIVAGAALQLPGNEYNVTLPEPWSYSRHYEERLQQFSQERAITPNDIVMLGNSITEGGKWESLLNNLNIRNRGISGDNTYGILKRLDSTLKDKPAKLFLLIGINDIARESGKETIINSINEIIKQAKSISPQTQIYLQSIMPVNESFNKFTSLHGKTQLIKEVNKELKAISKRENIEFIDLHSVLKNKRGDSLMKEYTYDGLHLNEEGYRAWAKKLELYIK